jgi:hypothetical protein
VSDVKADHLPRDLTLYLLARFVLVGVIAGATTTTDARIGAMGSVRLADHSALRIWLRRTVAALLLALGSVAVTTAALYATRDLTACAGGGCVASSRSTVGAALSDAAAASLVVVFASAAATAFALALRSELLTVVVVVVAFLLPSNHLGDAASWVTPTKWIAQLVQFEPYGLGSDYTGGQSADDHRGWQAVTGGALLAGATVALAWAGAVGIRVRSGQAERA